MVIIGYFYYSINNEDYTYLQKHILRNNKLTLKQQPPFKTRLQNLRCM
jgi:hypothetical protein